MTHSSVLFLRLALPAALGAGTSTPLSELSPIQRSLCGMPLALAKLFGSYQAKLDPSA